MNRINEMRVLSERLNEISMEINHRMFELRESTEEVVYQSERVEKLEVLLKGLGIGKLDIIFKRDIDKKVPEEFRSIATELLAARKELWAANNKNNIARRSWEYLNEEYHEVQVKFNGLIKL